MNWDRDFRISVYTVFLRDATFPNGEKDFLLCVWDGGASIEREVERAADSGPPLLLIGTRILNVASVDVEVVVCVSLIKLPCVPSRHVAFDLERGGAASFNVSADAHESGQLDPAEVNCTFNIDRGLLQNLAIRGSHGDQEGGDSGDKTWHLSRKKS